MEQPRNVPSKYHKEKEGDTITEKHVSLSRKVLFAL